MAGQLGEAAFDYAERDALTGGVGLFEDVYRDCQGVVLVWGTVISLRQTKAPVPGSAIAATGQSPANVLRSALIRRV